jgi:hypothetical protein
VGIIQFLMLLFFILLYVGIVGGLLARSMRRGMSNCIKGRTEEAQQIPLGG